MNIVFFTHSLLSDWNHGNAHFLRGVTTELLARGHTLRCYEPRDAWSLCNLRQDAGDTVLAEFGAAYPLLCSSNALRQYDADGVAAQLDAMLADADLVIVHEWNSPQLVAQIGAKKREHGFKLLFHDTHHRAASAPHEMSRYDLSRYDGALCFGNVVRELYLKNAWAKRAWTWHEAADTRVFTPRGEPQSSTDLVWIGNWGDDERKRELSEFLMQPARELQLSGLVHGVRYPDEARAQLRECGLSYGGYLPNFRAPQTFARSRVTVHIPRRPYVAQLPGIPTIRPFEALACGIPLISAPWHDVEELFRAGDFLWAHNGDEMKSQLGFVLHEPDAAQEIAARGRETILARHTCAHRVNELLQIIEEI